MPSPTDIRPPFDPSTARAKVRAAQDAWNTRDPIRVSLADTTGSLRCNRDEAHDRKVDWPAPGPRPKEPVTELGLA